MYWMSSLALMALPFALGDDNKQTDSALVQKPYARRALHSIAVLGDYLYLEGGQIYNSQPKNPGSVPVNHTFSIPLNKSWSISEVTYREIIHHIPPPIDRAALWSDTKANLLYRYAGSKSQNKKQTDPNHNLWQFVPDSAGGGTWAMSPPSNPEVFSKFGITLSGLTTFCDGMGIYAGGQGMASSDSRFNGTGESDETPVPGVLVYNTTTKAWDNDTQATEGPLDGPRFRGGAVCTDKWENGPLAVFFGGWRTKGSGAQDVHQRQLADMSVINLYDPVGKKWYWQKATGFVPQARDSFCTVGVQSTDSYDIFMYGGRDGHGDTSSDVYILSLPGFVWFKAEVESTPRLHHACAVAGNRQLLVSGGISKVWDFKESDPWRHALGVFDMTELKWKDFFDSSPREYESPTVVQDWYKEGGLNRVKWNDDAVKNWFSKESSNDPGDSKSGGKKSTPVGAIVGGVVGGVALIILAAVAAFLYKRRLARKHALSRATPSDTATGPSSPQSEKNTPAEVGDGHWHEMEHDGRKATFAEAGSDHAKQYTPPPQELP